MKPTIQQLQEQLDETVREKNLQLQKNEKLETEIFEQESKLSEQERLIKEQLGKMTSQTVETPETQAELRLKEQEILKLSEKLREAQTQLEIVKAERPRVSDAFRHSQCEESSQYMSKTDLDDTPGPADLDALRFLQSEKIRLEQELQDAKEEHEDVLKKYRDFEEQNQLLSLKNQQLSEENAEISKVLLTLDGEMKSKSEAEERLYKLSEDYSQLEKQFTVSEAQVLELTGKLEDSSTLNSKLQEKLSKKEAQHEALEKGYFELDKEYEELLKESQQNRDDMKEEQYEAAELRRELDEALAEVHTLKDHNAVCLEQIKTEIHTAKGQQSSSVLDLQDEVLKYKDVAAVLRRELAEKEDMLEELTTKAGINAKDSTPSPNEHSNEEEMHLIIEEEFAEIEALGTELAEERQKHQGISGDSVADVTINSEQFAADMTNLANYFEEAIADIVAHLSSKISELELEIVNKEEDAANLRRDNMHLSRSIENIMTDNETQVSDVMHLVLEVSKGLKDLGAAFNVSDFQDELEYNSTEQSSGSTLENVKAQLEQLQFVISEMNALSPTQSEQQGYDELLTSALALTAQRNDLRLETERLRKELEAYKEGAAVEQEAEESVKSANEQYMRSSGSTSPEYITLSVQTELQSAIKLEQHDYAMQTGGEDYNGCPKCIESNQAKYEIAQRLEDMRELISHQFYENSIRKLESKLHKLEAAYIPFVLKFKTIDQQLVAIITAQIDRKYNASQPLDAAYKEILDQEKQANEKLTQLERQLLDYTGEKGGKELDISLCMSELEEIQEDKDIITQKMDQELRDKISEMEQLNNDILQLKGKEQELERQIEEYKRETSEDAEIISDLIDQQTEKQGLSEENADLIKECEDLEHNRITLLAQCEQLREQANTLQTELNIEKELNSELTFEYNDIASELKECKDEETDLLTDVENCRVKVSTEQVELQKMELLLEEAAQDKIELQEQCTVHEAAKNEALGAELENGKLLAEINELKDKMSEESVLLEERQEAEEETAEFKVEIIDLENKCEALEKEERNQRVITQEANSDSERHLEEVNELEEQVSELELELQNVKIAALKAEQMAPVIDKQTEEHSKLLEEKTDLEAELSNEKQQILRLEADASEEEQRASVSEKEMVLKEQELATCIANQRTLTDNLSKEEERIAELEVVLDLTKEEYCQELDRVQATVCVELQYEPYSNKVSESCQVLAIKLQRLEATIQEFAATLQQKCETNQEEANRQKSESNNQIEELIEENEMLNDQIQNLVQTTPEAIEVDEDINAINKVQEALGWISESQCSHAEKLENINEIEGNIKDIAMQMMERLESEAERRVQELEEIENSIREHHDIMSAMCNKLGDRICEEGSSEEGGQCQEVMNVVRANAASMEELKELLQDDTQLCSSRTEYLAELIAKMGNSGATSTDAYDITEIIAKVEEKLDKHFKENQQQENEEISQLRDLVGELERERSSVGSATPQSLHGNSLSVSSPTTEPETLRYDQLGTSVQTAVPPIQPPQAQFSTVPVYASYGVEESLEIGKLNMRIAQLESELGRLRDVKIANCAIENEEYLKRENSRLENDLKETLLEYDLLKKQIIDMKTELEAGEITISELRQEAAVLREAQLKFETLSREKDLQDEQLQNLRTAFGEIRALVEAHFGDNSDIISQIEQLLSAKRQIIEKEKQILELEEQLKASNEERKQFRRRAREERDQKEHIERLNKQLELKVERESHELDKYRDDVREIREYAQEYASAVEDELRSRIV